MVIAKKPLKNKLNNKLVDNIINKGGSSATEIDHSTNDYVKITLRLPNKMIKIIDDHLKDSISKKTRTGWLREAAEEKITKDVTKSNL